MSLLTMATVFEQADELLRNYLEASGSSVADYEAFKAGASHRECSHCGKGFLFGPKSGHRSHRRFCADRCRVAAMRARRRHLDKRTGTSP